MSWPLEREIGRLLGSKRLPRQRSRAKSQTGPHSQASPSQPPPAPFRKTPPALPPPGLNLSSTTEESLCLLHLHFSPPSTHHHCPDQQITSHTPPTHLQKNRPTTSHRQDGSSQGGKSILAAAPPFDARTVFLPTPLLLFPNSCDGRAVCCTEISSSSSPQLHLLYPLHILPRSTIPLAQHDSSN